MARTMSARPIRRRSIHVSRRLPTGAPFLAGRGAWLAAVVRVPGGVYIAVAAAMETGTAVLADRPHARALSVDRRSAAMAADDWSPGRHVDHSARQLDEAGGVRWHAIVCVTPLAMRAQALVRAAVSVSSSLAPSTSRHALRPSNSMHVSHRTPAMRKLDQTTKLTRPRRTAAPSHDVHFMRASLPFRTRSAKPWGCGRMGGIMPRAGGRHRLWLGALGLLLGGATPGLAGTHHRSGA